MGAQLAIRLSDIVMILLPNLITYLFSTMNVYCRVNLQYNSTICSAILTGNHSNYSRENEEVQKVISTMHSWQQPVQSFTPLVLVLFLGSFSDRHKCRKPFFLMPIIGELFGIAGWYTDN